MPAAIVPERRKRSRTENAPWYREMLERNEASRRHCEAVQRRFSPYRAEPTCEHAALVETTCDYWHPPTLDAEGRVDVCFAVRARHFECAGCHVGVWPASDDVRANAPRRPACIRPACDCFAECPPSHLENAHVI